MRLHRRKRMPRKTKEQTQKENQTKKEETKSITKKVASTTKPSTTTKKNTPKATTTTKKKTTKTKKKVEPQKTSTKKVATTKKSNSKKTTTKKSTTTRKKATTKKTNSSEKKGTIVEYYDLPYRYNQTIVKVLAQTPTNLFIYWDISDKDRKNFEKQYGENFFETTKPILIIHNRTLGYSFEVAINDFANSWYLHVADSKCDYKIELGRRPIIKTEKLNNIDYIYITTSNEIESPNDKILFDNHQKMIYFKNVKTGQLTKETVSSISLIRNMGKIYNIYDLYQAIYQDENIEEIFDLSNPSSSNPSSLEVSHPNFNNHKTK